MAARPPVSVSGGAWRAVTLGVLMTGLAACDDAPVADPQTYCEGSAIAENVAPGPLVDVVVVVSDAASMAPYREPLLAHLAALGAAADTLGTGPLLHLAVVGDDSGGFTTTPQVEGCAPPDDDFAASYEQPWFRCDDGERCPERNFEGDLAEVVPCLGAVPATGDAPVALLDRLDRALGDGNPAAATFLRPDAALVVIVISAGDDASTEAPAAYAERLRATRAGAAPVYAAIVGPKDGPRLDALRAAFEGSSRDEISGGAWDGPVQALEATTKSDLLLAGCLPVGAVLDVDIATPGLQHDCVATEVDAPTGVEGAVIPPCELAPDGRPAATTPLPCFRLREPVEWERSVGCEHMAIIERAQWPHPRGQVHCACEP